MASATLDISDSFDVAASGEMVWEQLIDPYVVVACMPGAQLLEERDDGTFAGSLKIKLGPTVVTFLGNVAPEFDAARHEGRLVAQGGDGKGRTKVRATTNFCISADSGLSTVSVKSTIDVTGSLAGFVQSGGVHLSRRMIAEFGAAFSSHCVARRAAVDGVGATPAGDVAEVATRPVSGLRLGLAVMGDMVRAAVSRLLDRLRRRNTTNPKGHA